MSIFFVTLLLTLAVVGFVFAGVGIRILMKKNGEFRGTCASQSPFLKNSLGDCQVCGKPADETECRKDQIEPAAA